MMRIVDNHVHVGWFTDGYHSPQEIWQAEVDAGIDEFAVSSTSTCAELYKLVVKEMTELKRLGKDRVHPILWITPRMLDGRCRWALPYMLKKVDWEGVKMHWWSHHTWYYDKKLLAKAISLAKKLHVPLLIHTGETKETYPQNFQSLCQQNPDIQVILAHGRPPQQTIDVLKVCGNALVDTSFMPKEWKLQFIDRGFGDRLIFGTDVPINHIYWPEESHSHFIRHHLNELHEVAGEELYQQIISRCPYGTKNNYA